METDPSSLGESGVAGHARGRLRAIGLREGSSTRPLTTLLAAVALCLAMVPATAIPVMAGEEDTPATDRGWYNSDGVHDPTNLGYIIGDDGSSGGSQRVYRGFAVFDVPVIPDTIVKAELQLFNPGYGSSDATEHVVVYDVSTDITALRAGGSTETDIWADLGSGATYGSETVSLADNGQLVTIALNAVFRHMAQTGGTIAVGFALDSLDGNALTDERVFIASNAGSAVNLKLTTANLRPDGRIRLGGSGSFIGNDVRNTDAHGQTKTGSAKPGKTVTFGISAQNDGDGADKVSIKGSGSTSKFRVRYYKGSTDITSAVVAGTYKTASLSPGATQLVTVKVTVLSGAASGSKREVLVTLKSVGDPNRKDVVKAVAKRA